jgi:hypothetical protein
MDASRTHMVFLCVPYGLKIANRIALNTIKEDTDLRALAYATSLVT